MASEVLDGLLRANLAGAAAAVALLVLRGRLRPLIGPSAVYALWLVVPVTALASLLPARTVELVMQASPAGVAPVTPLSTAPSWDLSVLLIAVWLTGAAATAIDAGWRQLKFSSRFGLGRSRLRVVKAASNAAGPAVVGVFRPRILLPADFATRFSPLQRRVVLAHEGVHLARGDSRINACALLIQCLCWFNPVAHLAARAMRLDQELSCDAVVMARFPGTRRSYAEAMMKSQVGAAVLPIGCYWPARGQSALTRRLVMLRAAPVSRGRMAAGIVLAGLTAVTAGFAAWSAQPPRERIVLVAPAQTVVQALVQPRLATPRAEKAPRARSEALPVATPLVPQVQTATLERRPAPRLFSWTDWASMPMPADDGDSGPDAFVASGSAAPDGRMAGQSAGGDHTTSTYRNGAYQLKAEFSPLAEGLEATARLYKNGDVIATGTGRSTSGTAMIVLSNGQIATVEPGKMAYVITPQAPVWAGAARSRPQDVGPPS